MGSQVDLAIDVSAFSLTWTLVVQYPQWWRFEIIKLTIANAINASQHACPTQANRNRQSNVQDAHWSSSLNVVDSSVTARTLRELMGITIAAARGLIHPASAKPTAHKL